MASTSQSTTATPVPANAKAKDDPPMQPALPIGSNSINSFKSVADLIRLLPTGTVFLFQFLNPVLTNAGSSCSPANKALSAVLIALCGISCFFATFTDNYTGTDKVIHYGIATLSGLIPFSDPNPPPAAELAKYRLQLADIVHGVFSLIVFAVISLLDSNSVGCFYPGFRSTAKAALMAIPPAIGVVSTVVFTLFPANRHWVGYHAVNPSPRNSSNVTPTA